MKNASNPIVYVKQDSLEGSQDAICTILLKSQIHAKLGCGVPYFLLLFCN